MATAQTPPLARTGGGAGLPLAKGLGSLSALTPLSLFASGAIDI